SRCAVISCWPPSRPSSRWPTPRSRPRPTDRPRTSCLASSACAARWSSTSPTACLARVKRRTGAWSRASCRTPGFAARWSAAAADDLKRLGVNLVPAVTVGDRIAHGWNPDAYAKLLGIDYTASPKLSPTELAERLDRILEIIERLVRAVPDDQILFIPAERKRTVGQLAYHAFRLSIAFADAMDRGEMPDGWLQEQ